MFKTLPQPTQASSIAMYFFGLYMISFFFSFYLDVSLSLFKHETQTLQTYVLTGISIFDMQHISNVLGKI